MWKIEKDFPQGILATLVKKTKRSCQCMLNTQQELISTFFTAAEIPQELVEPLTAYIRIMTTSPKNSIKYFTEEEDSRIPGWKLYQTLRFVLKYAENAQSGDGSTNSEMPGSKVSDLSGSR